MLISCVCCLFVAVRLCLPAHCWLNPAGQKKKSVRFGTPLSPEVFDKTLPVSTPLRKGGTPGRAPTPGGGLKLRSALKPPQTADSDTAASGAGPGSPSWTGASPPLGRLGRQWEAADGGEEDETVDVVSVGSAAAFPNVYLHVCSSDRLPADRRAGARGPR